LVRLYIRDYSYMIIYTESWTIDDYWTCVSRKSALGCPSHQPLNRQRLQGCVDIPPRICQTELGVSEIFRIHPSKWPLNGKHDDLIILELNMPHFQVQRLGANSQFRCSHSPNMRFFHRSSLKYRQPMTVEVPFPEHATQKHDAHFRQIQFYKSKKTCKY